MLKPSIINVISIGLMAFAGVWVIDRALQKAGLSRFAIHNPAAEQTA